MNKQRRKNLGIAIDYLHQAKTIIDNVKLEEEFAYDNLPENLQYSNRGCDMEEKIDDMYDTLEKIDEVISSIDDIRL